MSPEEDFDDDDTAFSKMTPAEQEKQFLENFEKMSGDDQVAMRIMMDWMAFERPKDAPESTQEQYKEMFEEVRLEVIRRRLGGKVGAILPFKKPDKKE